MKKLTALLAVLSLLACLFTGCAKTETPAPAPEDKAPVTMALVVAGTFGDRSFYDSSKEGADKLAAECGVKVTTIECNNENHEPQMRNAADNNQIVVCVGWEFYDIETVAPDYPDVKFIWIDNATSAPVPNVLNITYAQNEGSFLAGYIAAAMSQNGCIGAVGGEDSDTINDFIVGYKQGAAAYNPETRVEVSYTGTYDDAAVGKECGLALHDQGADVIFQIASAAGSGVFEAAKEEGFYAIGVDCDQKYIDPAVIICSMKKEVGLSIFQSVKEYLDGDESKFGTTWVADLADGYVGIGYGSADMEQQVPNPLKEQIEAMTLKIISGEIVVDSTRK